MAVHAIGEMAGFVFLALLVLAFCVPLTACLLYFLVPRLRAGRRHAGSTLERKQLVCQARDRGSSLPIPTFIALPVSGDIAERIHARMAGRLHCFLLQRCRASRRRRDYALLLTMYNTGARVSEITALRQEQVQFAGTSLDNLTGKGRKERSIPLWSNTAQVLKAWFHELERTSTTIAFPSHRGRQLSRNGVDYILQQAVGRAGTRCPSLIGKRISPHVVRHTTAIHLLQSGVDISLIALWLGHESIETTHVYIDADLATKERALEKLAPVEAATFRFKPSDSVLAFLQQL